MKLLERLDFEQVLRGFYAEHGLDSDHEANTNSDGEMHLQRAEALLGRWGRVRLSSDEVRNVVLPWHLSERGALPLVPKSGLTVAQAADVVRASRRRYAAANPVCWRKLARMRTEPITPVYLSTSAIDAPDYSELDVRHGLIHLDGLHRLVSWELDGRLNDGGGVVAYVAGAG